MKTTKSSGNVFKDLGLPNPEKLAKEAKEKFKKYQKYLKNAKFIFVVEYRGPKISNSTIAFAGSSLNKVKKFIMNNKDYNKSDKKWWWAVIRIALNKESPYLKDDLTLFDQNCNELY